jgi:hypothetical protein
MLQIRAEQMAVFDTVAKERFIDKVARFLRDQLTEACAALDDQALRAQITRSMEAAGQYAITRQWDLARFAACWICLGEGFESRPGHTWPQRILACGDLHPTLKMDWIEKHYLRPRLRRSTNTELMQSQ